MSNFFEGKDLRFIDEILLFIKKTNKGNHHIFIVISYNITQKGT